MPLDRSVHALRILSTDHRWCGQPGDILAHMIVAIRTIALTVLLMLGMGSAAIANELASEETSDADALWELRIAAFGRYGPAYPASKETQGNFVPLPIPVYRGRFLRLFEDSENPIRGRVFQRDRIKLDLDFDLTFPSDSDDIDARTGMPDLDLLVEVGPELELEFARQDLYTGRWYLALQARLATSFDGLDPTYRGISFSTELRYVAQLTSRDEAKLRITPTFATGKYMDYYYRVAPEFATPSRAAYEAKPGYLGTDITVNWTRNFSKNLSTVIGARLGLYSGARNDDSPLFTEDVTSTVYGAIMYKFWESKRRAVPRPDEGD